MAHLRLQKHYLVLFVFGTVAGVSVAHANPKESAEASNRAGAETREASSSFRQIGNLPIPKNLTVQMSDPSTISSAFGWGAGGPGAGGGGVYATGGGAAGGGRGVTAKGGSGGGSGVSSGGHGSGQGCTTGICAGGMAEVAYDPTRNGTERRGANGFGFGSGSPGKGGGGGLGVGGGSGAGGGGGDRLGGTGGGSAAAAGAGAVGSGRTNTTEGFGAVTGTGYTGPLPSQKAKMSQLKGKVKQPAKVPNGVNVPPKFALTDGRQGQPRRGQVAVVATAVPVQPTGVQGRTPGRGSGNKSPKKSEKKSKAKVLPTAVPLPTAIPLPKSVRSSFKKMNKGITISQRSLRKRLSVLRVNPLSRRPRQYKLEEWEALPQIVVVELKDKGNCQGTRDECCHVRKGCGCYCVYKSEKKCSSQKCEPHLMRICHPKTCMVRICPCVRGVAHQVPSPSAAVHWNIRLTHIAK